MYPRAAGCFQACLSATCDSSDAFKLHAFADKTHFMRYADTFHFSTPSEFSKVDGYSAGTSSGTVSPTPSRPPRRLRLRSQGRTYRMTGRLLHGRLRQYPPGRRQGTHSTGRSARWLAPVPEGRHEEPEDEKKAKSDFQKQNEKSDHDTFSCAACGSPSGSVPRSRWSASHVRGDSQRHSSLFLCPKV